jgi:hypothetical protein
VSVSRTFAEVVWVFEWFSRSFVIHFVRFAQIPVSKWH